MLLEAAALGASLRLPGLSWETKATSISLWSHQTGLSITEDSQHDLNYSQPQAHVELNLSMKSTHRGSRDVCLSLPSPEHRQGHVLL